MCGIVSMRHVPACGTHQQHVTETHWRGTKVARSICLYIPGQYDINQYII